jgi:hypothetical protein
MFDMEYLVTFADDTFIPRIGKSLSVLIEDIKKSLKALKKCLKDSGLKVLNQRQNCIFSKKEM